MRLECPNCQGGDHAECHQRGQMREVVCQCDCPTATSARKMLRVQPPATPPTHPDQQTDMLIPVYGLLDLWMALGYDSEEFEAQYLTHGYADTWAWLLARVRDLNNGLKAIEREESQAAASLGVKENGDPIYQRAKRYIEQFDQYDEVDMRVNLDDVVTNAAGQRVRGTLRAVLTVEGRLS